jgi:hypothetical protein
MVARALVPVAVMLWTPTAARAEPILAIDPSTLVDDAITWSGHEALDPIRAIADPVASPPVSLWEATQGLVSDDGRDGERQVAVELERVYRALKVASSPPPTSRR